MRAKTIKTTSTEEFQSALQESMDDGFKPTLAIAFVSKSQDRKAITAILSQHDIAVFGCTTNGEFISEDLKKVLQPFYCLT